MPKRWHNVVETNVRPEGSGVTKDLLYVNPRQPRAERRL
jgi:hypothetical protein